MTCRVLLADDHVIVREGLKNILLQEGFEVAGEASDGKRAVELAKGIRPDIALIDFSMPVLNGIDAAREIHALLPQTKTILLTMYKEEQYVLEALRAGIKGDVLKTQAGGGLVPAVRALLPGGTRISPGGSSSVCTTATANRAARTGPCRSE